MKTKNTKNGGFTIVKIIAVLVIIGTMAAVAAPKFINRVGKARAKAAWAGINEAKALLSVAHAKAYQDNDGSTPDVADVVVAADFGESGSDALPQNDIWFGDIRVDITASGTTAIEITVDQYNGTDWDAAWGTAPSDLWELPTS